MPPSGFVSYCNYKEKGYELEFTGTEELDDMEAYILKLTRPNGDVITSYIDSDGTPYFSEIGQFAGVSNTDWSWSALIADFNLDGTQEIFITNGIIKRPNDMDYLKFTIDEQEKIMN